MVPVRDYDSELEELQKIIKAQSDELGVRPLPPVDTEYDSPTLVWVESA
jgi:hypothetical protein